MKNTIIVILLIFLAFFLLNALGVFNFGSIVEHETRKNFARQRLAAVSAGQTFNIGVVGDLNNALTRDALDGIKEAAAKINSDGGILQKQIKLHVIDANNLPSHNSAIQEFCMQKDIALCFGPFNSAYLPSMRALSQYQALPLVSSFTTFSENLPVLEPENYITFFPAIENWTEAIIKNIHANKYKNILIVAPDKNSYGDIFATALERIAHRTEVFTHIYRLNYQTPFRKNSFSRIMRDYTAKNLYDTIIFTGTYPDFLTFCELGKELEIKSVVYGTVDLDVKELTENKNLLFSDLRLPYMDIPKKKSNDMNHLSSEVIFAIRDVLAASGKYDPETLIEELYKYQNSNEFKTKLPITIKIKEITLNN